VEAEAEAEVEVEAVPPLHATSSPNFKLLRKSLALPREQRRHQPKGPLLLQQQRSLRLPRRPRPNRRPLPSRQRLLRQRSRLLLLPLRSRRLLLPLRSQRLPRLLPLPNRNPNRSRAGTTAADTIRAEVIREAMTKADTIREEVIKVAMTSRAATIKAVMTREAMIREVRPLAVASSAAPFTSLLARMRATWRSTSAM